MFYALCIGIVVAQAWLGWRAFGHWFNEQQDSYARSPRDINCLFAGVLALSLLPAALLLPLVLSPWVELGFEFFTISKRLVLGAPIIAWLPLAGWAFYCHQSQARRPLLILQCVNLLAACFEAGLIVWGQAMAGA